MAKIDPFLRLMIRQGASDLHLSSGVVPTLRIGGELQPVQYAELGFEELIGMLEEITPAARAQAFKSSGEVQFVHDLAPAGRFRANLFRHAGGVSAVFRHVPAHIPTLEQLSTLR